MYYLLVITICLSFVFFKYNIIYSVLTRNRSLTFGTGEENTPYFIFADKIKEIIKLDKLTDFNLNIKTKDVNSIKNIMNVNSGKYDIGICQEEFFRDAYLGGGGFKKAKQTNIRFVCGLFFELLTFLVDGELEFNKLQQITEGIPYTKDGVDYRRNVIMGTTKYGSGSNASFRSVLLYMFPNIDIKSIYDRKTEDFVKNTIYLLEADTNYIFNAFYQKTNKLQIDGIFLTSIPNNKFIKNIIKKKKSVKFLNIYDDYGNLSIFKNFLYLKELNLSDFYDEINKFDKIRSYASRAIIIANKDANIDDVYYLTKKIFENNMIFYRNLIQKNDSEEYVRDFDPVEMSQVDKNLPIHPGAHKYLTEANLITRKTKYKYDLAYYADKVKDYYWKYPEFNLS
jgi:TRAP-type uncharacterized transport system substrate-binding protein